MEATPGPGGAASTLLAEGRRRYEGGDYAEAEPLAQGAVRTASELGDERTRVAALQLVGECLFSLGRYGEAAAVAADVMALRSGASDEDRAETRNLQGVIALAAGDAAGGAAAIDEALALREAVLGPDHPDTLEALNNSGVALARLERVTEAIAVHEEALRRCERAFHEPTRQLVVTCNALAVKLDREEATRPRARALYDRAIEAGEAALGPEHPLVVTLYANAGTCAVNAGDREDGRQRIEHALVLHERRYGPSHPNTATVLLTGSFLAREAGELSLALERAERAIRIRLETFGVGDARTRQALLTVLRVHDAAFSRGAAGVPGLDPADGVALLAAYRDLGGAAGIPDAVRFAPDPVAGERVLRAYLDRVEARRGAPDPRIVRALARAAAAGLASDTALLAGDTDAAAVGAAARTSLVEEALGPTSTALVEPLHRQATVERARGAGDVALELDRRAFDILGAAYGERHPFVLRARALLVAETSRIHGPAAARADLEALLLALESAEPGGWAAHLRDRVARHLGTLAEDRGRPPGRRTDA